jgi:hypothetical protein
MTEAAVVRSSSCVKATLAVALLATASCSSMSVPTAESIANLPFSGHVTITEEFVTGLGWVAER